MLRCSGKTKLVTVSCNSMPIASYSTCCCATGTFQGINAALSPRKPCHVHNTGANALHWLQNSRDKYGVVTCN